MNTMEGTANRKGQRIVITVAKKPHTGSLIRTPQSSKDEAGELRRLFTRMLRALRGA
jgi:hypothetical protein